MVECSRCGEKRAVINLRYMDESYCRDCFSHLYEKRVKRTVRKHGMIEKEDKVALAVSGGKDSLSMANVLNKIHRNLVIIAVDEGVKGYRDEAIDKVKEFAEEKEVPLEIYSFEEEYGKGIDEIVEGGEEKSCSYCGVFRRQILNKAARELKCDKIATGHNLDDETQTIMMNFVRGEAQRLARMGPTTGLKEHGKFVPRIKPIRKCSEKENTVYAMVNGIDFEEKGCPYANSDYRVLSRDYLNDLEYQQPGSKFSILSAYDQILPAIRRYYREETGEINQCRECGEPTSGEICKACEMERKISDL